MLRLCRSPVRKASGFPVTLIRSFSGEAQPRRDVLPLDGQASLTALGGGKAAKFAVFIFQFAMASALGGPPS